MKKHKKLYFSKLELIDWVKTGRKKTIAEIQEEVDHSLATKKRRV